ncbi:MAG: hypothetical protein GY772_19025 [bacterium]|nr:hypothetical protein [bacterium]
MANTSTKNFPHAYGAGRCIAAFSLSHPGGPLAALEEATCPPPAVNQPTEPEFDAALAGFPDVSDTTTEDSPGVYTRRIRYVPDHQPLNATSFGVYATGSGTKRLPYRDAIAPFVPDPPPGDPSIAPVAAPLLPESEGNIKRPFGIVDDAKLGDSSAQAVFRVESDDPTFSAQSDMWYEVALDWSIPDQVLDMGYAGLPFAFVRPHKWASDQAASVRRALARTLWVGCSIAPDALTESVPGMAADSIPDIYDGLQQGAVAAVPQPANADVAGSAGAYDDTRGMQAPYSYPGLVLPDGEQTFLPIADRYPALMPDPDYPDDNLAATAATPRAGIDVLVTGYALTISNVLATGEVTAASVGTARVSFAPVVRVWNLVNVAPLVCRVSGIPRLGLSPVSETSDVISASPGAINVQVVQKNSSAVDGTDDPAYDLYDGWSQLGTAPAP